MSNIMNIDSVQQYNDYFGIDTLHPLVTVIEGCKGKPLHFCKKFYKMNVRKLPISRFYV